MFPCLLRSMRHPCVLCCCSTVDKVVSRSARYYMTIYVCLSVCTTSDPAAVLICDMRWIPIKSCQSTGAIKHQTLHVRAHWAETGSRFLQAIDCSSTHRVAVRPYGRCSGHGAIVDDQVPNIAPCHVVRPQEKRREEKRRRAQTHTRTHTRTRFYSHICLDGL